MQPLLPRKSNKYNIFWLCVNSVRYPARNAHASYCHLRSVRLCSIFLHYLINGTIFGKMILNIKCVFWFSLQILSEMFLTLRFIQRDVLTSSCKVPVILIIFNETWLLSSELTRTALGAELFHAVGGTEGRTDWHYEVNSRFINFANAPNKTTFLPQSARRCYTERATKK